MKKQWIVLMGMVFCMTTAAHAGSMKGYAGAMKRVCPVSGEEIGSMGKGVEVEHNGKTVKLCCAMCKKSFYKNADQYVQDMIAGEKENMPHLQDQ